MMLLALILVPALGGLAAFALRAPGLRRGTVVATALLHAALTAAAWLRHPAPAWQGALALDAPGLLVLSITSALFLVASIYAVGYLAREGSGQRADLESGFLFANQPEAVFSGCLLLFLATMTLVALSQHFTVLWIAVEATTLASAPLIYFHRQPRSLEATWKYLLVCSVGIGLALLGTFFLSVAATRTGTEPVSLLLSDLVAHAGELQVSWLELAFVLLLVGYGTKMGLAPLHTWLPDAHSESPSVVSALMSGALLNGAFLGVLRAYQVCCAAGLGAWCGKLLTFFGLLSLAVAAAFLLGQTDYKRLLAYSSVEHMGILSLGVGLGGQAAFGALLHAVNHSLAKAMLFLAAGNILGAYRTKSVLEVRGVVRVLPFSGVLWIAGLLAITGSPPFGTFLSELTILRGALEQGRGVVAATYLVLLGVIFVAMASAMLRMAQGTPPAAEHLTPRRESPLSVWPPAVLGLAVLLLGLYVPPALDALVRAAARALGGP